jgi:Ni/Co efflux regulator RcnB
MCRTRGRLSPARRPREVRESNSTQSTQSTQHRERETEKERERERERQGERRRERKRGRDGEREGERVSPTFSDAVQILSPALLRARQLTGDVCASIVLISFCVLPCQQERRDRGGERYVDR